MIKKYLQILSILAILIIAASCASRRAYEEGVEAEMMGNWDRAIYNYTLALKNDPTNPNYRIRLDKARKHASRAHLRKAQILFEQGKEMESFREFKLAIELDPENENAEFLYEQARDKYRSRMEEQRDKRRRELKDMSGKGVPGLKLESPDKITLDFNNKRVKEIYLAMGKLAAINIFFEETLKNNLTSFSVKDMSFLEALETFAMVNRHFFKIVNDKSIFVIPDTAQMRKDYESSIARVFFLENIEAKLVRDYLRTIVGLTRFVFDDKLNAVIIRGNLGQIAAAEQLVDILDRPRAEAIIDVEILEVSRSDLNDIGLLFGGNYKVTQSTRSVMVDQEQETVTVGGNNLSFFELSDLGEQNLFLTIPSFTMNFLRQDSNTRMVAKPKIRLVDKEKAQYHVGESVPVRSTTFNPASTVGGNVVPIDSYKYQDIGIMMEFEPTVHNESELTLKLTVEISSKLFENEAGLPTFGKKKISSVIRLRDGETNMLAGLIKEDEKKTLTGVAGLSEVPLLGRLFSDEREEISQMDTIITITPYILSSPEITERELRAILVGTESHLGMPLSEILNDKAKEEGESVLIDDKKIEELLRDEPIPEEKPEEATPRTPETPRQDVIEEKPDAREIPEAYGEIAEVTIQPGVVSVVEGSSFTVQVVIKNGNNVSHAPFYLLFDPNHLEVLKVTQGAFMSQDGAQVSFLHSENNTTGTIRVGFSRLGAEQGVSGTGVLAVITFKAKEKGKSYLTFTNCSLKNVRAENLPAEFLPTEVQVD